MTDSDLDLSKTQERQRKPMLVHRDALEHIVKTESRLATLEATIYETRSHLAEKIEYSERAVRTEMQAYHSQLEKVLAHHLGESHALLNANWRSNQELSNRFSAAVRDVEEQSIPRAFWYAASGVIIALASTTLLDWYLSHQQQIALLFGH